MKKIDFNKTLEKIGIKFIIKYKYIILLLIIGILVFCFLGFKNLKMDSSNESFFAKTDKTVEMNNKFKEIFGNEDFIFILIEADDVFDFNVLSGIRNISNELEKQLPFIKDTISLTNVEFTESDNDFLIVEDLIGEEIPKSRSELNQIRKKVLSKELLVDRIITKDCRKTGIIVNFERIPEFVFLPVKNNFNPLDQEKWSNEKIIMQDKIYYEIDENSNLSLTKVYDPRKLIAPSLNVILKKYKSDDYKITATGLPVIDYESDRVILTDGAKIGLVALILAVLLLIIIFRNFQSVIAPFFVMIFTVIIVFGIMGFLKFPINISAIIIIPLLLVISVSYSIHVINHFLQKFNETGNREEALSYTFYHSAWPCFITCVTTVVGFISFIIVPIKPIRNMGIICGIGVFITYILVIVIIPIFFSFGKKYKYIKKRKINLDIPQGFFVKWADFVVNKSIISAIITIIIIGIMIFFSFKINVDSELMNMIGNKVSYVRDAKYITDKLGGIYSIEILVELPENDMAKDPKILNSLENIEKMTSNWEETSLSFSIINFLKDINKTMNNNDEKYNKIPESKNLIAQYLLLYEMSGGDSLDEWVDYDFKTLRLSVNAKKFSTKLSKKFKQLEIFAKLNFPPGTKFSVTGDMPIMIKMIDMLSWGQIQSIFAALAAITVMMIIILKSFKAALISMIPNIIPIGVITGIMGLFKFNIDLLTVMIAPMIIGIAVDDTVHYFVHFRQEFDKTGNYKIANRETFKKIGKAILFTSIILIIGYGVFCFSQIKSMFHLAILSSAGIFSALAADLFITPALFVLLKPFKREVKQ